jgi:hypothetical protein
MENPYEAPRSPVEPEKGRRLIDSVEDLGYAFFGFVVAGCITGGVAMVTIPVLGLVGGQQDWLLGLLFASPAIVGPAVGIALWAATRQRKRVFARGALVFGVVSFLLVGGCWAMFLPVLFRG